MANITRRCLGLVSANLVGQLTTVSKFMYMGAVDAPPPVSSGLALHACTYRVSPDAEGHTAELSEVLVAAPMGSTQADDFDEAQLLNYAVGHTNPIMAQRFKQIGASAPRVSINATVQALPEPDLPGAFTQHFAEHPLAVKRGKTSVEDWAVRRLQVNEVFYVHPDGEKEKATLEGDVVYPKVAAVANAFAAKLNSDPEQLLRICNRVYGQALTGAFVFHLDHEAFYVMGTEGQGWREYRMDYGAVVASHKELAAFLEVTQKQATA